MAMVLEGEEFEFVWKTICDLQLVFHPKYSPEGNIDFKAIYSLRHKKKIYVMLDRNILSSLLKLSREGCLKDEREMRVLALLMTWMLMNDFPVSAGLALKEYATRINCNLQPVIELCEFQNIFKYYPEMIWLRLAEGVIDSIPVCTIPIKPYDTEILYHEEDSHFLMHIATMLHIVFLCRQKDLSAAEKMVDFLNWNYKHLLISECTVAYAAMLFTNQPGIKAPRNSRSDSIEKIVDGCKNQAWDLNYLSNWSCFHYDEKNMKEIFLFATNDTQLKMIFINTYAPGGVGALMDTVFSKSDAQKVADVVNANSGHNRVKPDFGNNPSKYFRNLIEREKILIAKTFC